MLQVGGDSMKAQFAELQGHRDCSKTMLCYTMLRCENER